MSSVKNLLAMFEKQGDAKPPERGRSPGGPPAPSSVASGTESPRPLSKIRTSFVAIEKDGRIGLTRDQSGGSSVSRRRMSTDTEGGATVPPAEQQTSSQPPLPFDTENSMIANKSPSPEPPTAKSQIKATVPVPEVAASSKSSPKQKDASPATTPIVSETKRVEASLPKSPPKAPESLVAPGAVKGEGYKENPKEKLEQTEQEAPEKPVKQSSELPKQEPPKAEDAVSGPSKKTNGKPTPKPTRKGVKTAEKKTSSSPPDPALAPISIAKTNTKAKKSPGITKTTAERTPAKSPAPAHDRRSTPVKSAVGTHGEKEARGIRTSKTTTKAAATAAAVKPTITTGSGSATSAGNLTTRKAGPASTSTIPPSVGATKPKPKSPTKPIRLPASLMAQTASSVHKAGTGVRQSHSRTGHYVPLSATSHIRSPSRASIGPPPSAHANSTARPLRRQSSSISRLRPSIGPPPKQVAKDHPPTRREKEVDEGFLARMMRPTQASASKVHEKVQLPTTPPRMPQATNRVSDQGALPLRKLTPAKKSPPSRDSTPHAAANSTTSKSPEATPTTPRMGSSLSKTPSITEEEDHHQPESAKTEELGDDTLVEKADSTTKNEEEGNIKDQNGNPAPAVPTLVENLPTPVEPTKQEDPVIDLDQSHGEDGEKLVEAAPREETPEEAPVQIEAAATEELNARNGDTTEDKNVPTSESADTMEDQTDQRKEVGVEAEMQETK
ncbi:hypothetical protein MKZ38_007253 [Zalerion maritima]|uniref:Uncharacterized protein n=1 Tax=Zalerion maritima TaxID=339359 RepID=A0AAD5RMU8_9PEZI|nr:hypothetical protein MKZ38_007253 [Zalerion maritima]